MLATDRVVMIRYTTDGTHVGSGLRVGGQFVLTADHCAQGNDHEVVIAGVEYPASVHVRSNTGEVDLAVLSVAAAPKATPMGFAKVDRSVAARIAGCQALGFPRWKRNAAGKRVLAQVDGYVPTAEGSMPSVAADAPTTITLKAFGPTVSQHPVPVGGLDQPGSPWAGMSGAVVVVDDLILGVIRSHNFAEGQGSLTVTPIEAIKHLEPERAERLWAALKANPNRLVTLPDPASNRREVLAELSPTGRPLRLREVKDLSIFGVRRARTDVERRGDPFFPYVPWHVDQAIRQALERRVRGDDMRMLLLAGEAMSGKSRAAAHALLRDPALTDSSLLIPQRGPELRQVADLISAEGAVLWLDDLNEYFAWLDRPMVDRWRSAAGLVVVATVRSEQLDALRRDTKLRAAWAVVGDDSRVERIRVDIEWSSADQTGLATADPMVREAVAEGAALGEVLGAADELRIQLDIADPRQRGLIDLVADWTRTGLNALPEETAARLWSRYLPDREGRQLDELHPEEARSRFVDVRTWGCEPVAGTGIALLVRTRNGLRADGYIVSRRATSLQPVPLAVWEAALADAEGDPERLLAVGFQAATGDAPSRVAERAWQPLAAAGQTTAQYNLGRLRVELDPPDVDGARQWWEQAAAAGDTAAQYNLGHLLAELDPPDIDGARQWYGLAAAAGDTDAQTNLGRLLAELNPPDIDGARWWLEQAATAGHPPAQHNLAVLLTRLHPPDIDSALHWSQHAASAGLPMAQSKLGLLLAGLDPPDIDGARHWWEQAAAAGHTDAKHNLGMLLTGLDPPDIEGALRWYERAAADGHVAAQYEAGLLLYPTNIEAARRWWEQAAAAGHTDAQHNLGVLLAGLNPPDIQGARHWSERAAASGHIAAQHNLGVLLESEDVAGAQRWYEQAAAGGYAAAQSNLGLLLAGLNPPDIDGARQWLEQAAAAGHPAACENLKVLFGPSQADNADSDSRDGTALLDGIEGAYERAQRGLDQAAAGSTVPLEQL